MKDDSIFETSGPAANLLAAVAATTLVVFMALLSGDNISPARMPGRVTPPSDSRAQIPAHTTITAPPPEPPVPSRPPTRPPGSGDGENGKAAAAPAVAGATLAMPSIAVEYSGVTLPEVAQALELRLFVKYANGRLAELRSVDPIRLEELGDGQPPVATGAFRITLDASSSATRATHGDWFRRLLQSAASPIEGLLVLDSSGSVSQQIASNLERLRALPGVRDGASRLRAIFSKPPGGGIKFSLVTSQGSKVEKTASRPSETP